MATRKFHTLQEWMEATGTSARALLARVKAETGHSISDAMFSYMLRGSRRISRHNAFVLSAVTGIDMDDLTKWPKSSEPAKPSGKGQKSAA